jgi:hypothetical protein
LDAALSSSNTVIPGVIKAVRDLDLTLFYFSFFFVLVTLLSTYFVVRSVWLDSGVWKCAWSGQSVDRRLAFVPIDHLVNMLTLHGFSACIESNGTPLPEYLVSVDEKASRVSCWIPGVEGQVCLFFLFHLLLTMAH